MNRSRLKRDQLLNVVPGKGHRIAGCIICQVYAGFKGNRSALVHPLLPERGHLCLLLGRWLGGIDAHFQNYRIQKEN